MTENEAKRILDGIDEVWGDLPEDGNDVEIALMMAKDALEEIQQYRAIGTVEEFKILKEKAEPKKIAYQIGKNGLKHEKCPTCGSFSVFRNYCSWCGQKIDWGNE
jgi:CRISPR/Cas system-associated protein Cas10 (large subunit of type III CRISPR-Cas system)